MCNAWALERTKQDQMPFQLTRGRLWTHRDEFRSARISRATSSRSILAVINGNRSALCRRSLPKSARLGCAYLSSRAKASPSASLATETSWVANPSADESRVFSPHGMAQLGQAYGYASSTFSKAAISSFRFPSGSRSRFCRFQSTAGSLSAPGMPRRSHSGVPFLKPTRKCR